GTPKPTADGTAHYDGAKLSTSASTSTPTSSTSSSVTDDGTITAGTFHELTINIPADPTNSANFVDATAVQVNPDNPPYLPVAVSHDPSFKPHDFINANFSQLAAQLLDKGTSSTPVGALTFPALYVAGGNVTVNAGTLKGTGSITAEGAPTISVTNDSPD